MKATALLLLLLAGPAAAGEPLAPGVWHLLAPADAPTPAHLTTADPDGYGDTWQVWSWSGVYVDPGVGGPLDPLYGVWFISDDPVEACGE